jgi:hypothetical protein
VVCAIGASDGDFDDKEKAAWRLICLELGLNPADFEPKELNRGNDSHWLPTADHGGVGLALGALLLDMVTHRDDKPITGACLDLVRVLGGDFLAFAGFLYVQHGPEVASLFVTGYALEKVPVDNLFVFMAIFAWFKVPDGCATVLYWGIIGAIVFRGVFVAIGTGLLAFGPWVEIVFALIVAWTACDDAQRA